MKRTNNVRKLKPSLNFSRGWKIWLVSAAQNSILLLAAAGCSTQHALWRRFESVTGSAHPVVTLQNAGCDGDCPVYTLALFANGSALLLPELNMPFTEDQITAIAGDQRALISGTLAVLDTSLLHSRYPTEGHSNLPLQKVGMYQRGKWTEITVQSGEPPHLTELLLRLEALVSVSRWKRVVGVR